MTPKKKAVEAERDRYREALEAIRKDCPKGSWFEKVCTKALASKYIPTPLSEKTLTKQELLQKIEGASDDEINEIVFSAMDEHAKQEAIAFADWAWENRWFSKQDGLWHYTFDHGTAMSTETYKKHYTKTTEQLYNLFKSKP